MISKISLQALLYRARLFASPLVISGLLVLLVSLTASTTYNAKILKHYLLGTATTEAYEALWPAAKNGSHQALDALTAFAISQNDIFWLKKSASLESVDAQVHLATIASSEKKQLYWYQQAAKNGHAESLFEVALREPNTKKRLNYLEQSAKRSYSPAILALAKYWYDTHDTMQARQWLSLAAEFDVRSEFQLAGLLWRLGDREQAKQAFSNAALSYDKAKVYADIINNMQPQTKDVLMAATDPLRSECSQQLQFIATTLDSAVQARRFKQAFEADERFYGIPICVNPVVWLSSDELNCEMINHRQQCDLSAIAKHSFKPNFTHFVMFLPTGTAYVQNGIMHLDQADTYSVFVHELAHFVGFVDEYAVSPMLAAQYCEAGDAPNLLLAENAEQSYRFLQWQDYSDALPSNLGEKAETSIYYESNTLSNSINKRDSFILGASKTCAKLGIDAFKPSQDITFLEHHDTDNVPPIYLAIWQGLLAENHHNVAIAEYFKQLATTNDLRAQAQHWDDFYF